jgi:sn-glycerol 3-phosphate transport system ATP-binding protein
VLQVEQYGVQVQDLVKIFPAGRNGGKPVQALNGVDLKINRGELFVILGPSGCGKSTLLRSVAGIEEPEQGSVWIGGTQVYNAQTGESVAAQHRFVGMVFQNFALYPHLSVSQNVGFGLQSRKVPKAEIGPRVHEALRIVDMLEFAGRTPAALSGGQQQRVALARAIAGNPHLLLFDEPLSNLDPLLRTSVRTELKQLIDRLQVTSIFVTHDQEEAMIMGDRIAVMNAGRVEQIGTPDEIYHHPASRFVAEFTGRPVTNLIEGVVDRYKSRPVLVPIEGAVRTLAIDPSLEQFMGQRILVHARPEDVQLEEATDDGDEAQLVVSGVLPEGGHTFVHLDPGGGSRPIVVRCRPDLVHKKDVGSRRAIAFERGNIYSPESGKLLASFS